MKKIFKAIKKVFCHEKHTHNYSGERLWVGKIEFIKCTDPNCNCYDLTPEQEERDMIESDRFDSLLKDYKELKRLPNSLSE